MDLATIQAIFSALEAVASFLIKYGPSIFDDVSKMVADLRLAWISATSGEPLTDDQKAQIDQALADSKAALDAAFLKQQTQV